MNVLKSYIRTAGEEYKHKEDHCSFRCSFGACIFFRLSFNNCRSCICNWNDLLTLHCLHCPLQTNKFQKTADLFKNYKKPSGWASIPYHRQLLYFNPLPLAFGIFRVGHPPHPWNSIIISTIQLHIHTHLFQVNPP